MSKILVSGASGFIGKAVVRMLLEQTDHEVVALSRYERTSDHPRLVWKRCDLFSLKDLTEAMVGVDYAFYLVHSMLPSASLSQGTFYDFDLLLADNFRRAAEMFKIRHIIYLGGMIPDTEHLSWHLKSRLEVEQTLRSSPIPVTALRAGLIIGPEGSSFTILERLTRRLPMLICPAWTSTLSQPIALQDVLKVCHRLLKTPSLWGRVFDIGGKEVVTYQGLIQKTAHLFGKRKPVYNLNLIPLALSRLWVSLITGVSKDLVYPLVLSLKHPMLVAKKHEWPYPEDLSTKLDQALTLSQKKIDRKSFTGYLPKHKDVRSIQRLVLPKGKNAQWVAEEYFRWLPRFFSKLIRTQIVGNRCRFYLLHPSFYFLELERSLERSTADRQLLYIVGGILVKVHSRGRLEFREVLNRNFVLAAIHEFTPALPWFIYRYTQAIIHLIVMNAFGRHLRNYKEK
jgi:uncharacterized protein YbjT (DUF2867 family)